jgi:type II secretory pathway predicted ATPase ExeA
MDPKKLQALYGLKYNPFSLQLPIDALHRSPRIDEFINRVSDLVATGGFAAIDGPPGGGKSVVLRLVADRLSRMRDVVVGEITRPQSRLSDFYRELASIFGIIVSSSNRWGGYKMLREKWQSHIESTLMRPVLLVDEAQEVPPSVLDELRLLGSTRFDSCTIVTVVIAGDQRLAERLKTQELAPLESRIRARLHMTPANKDELMDVLSHAIEAAGNPNLMTEELMSALAEHSAGNFRLLMTLANEVLELGVVKESRVLDEGLFLETSSKDRPAPMRSKNKARRMAEA